MLEKGFEMDTTPSTRQIPPDPSYATVSRGRMFHVLRYSPSTGGGGTTLTIDTLFNHTSGYHDVHIRIVIGSKPIPTVIKNIGGSEVSNLWRCSGTVPEFASQKYASTHTVSISIEAIVTRNVVLDSVAFGFFTYREYGLFPSIPLHPGALGAPLRECSPFLHVTRPPTPQSVPLHQVTQSRTSPAPIEGEESKPTLAWKRILRRYECKRGVDSDRVSFKLEGDLKSLGKNLSDEEIARRRRLVRFIRKEEGNTLRLFFYPIRQEDYEEGFFVISCIYYDDDTWCTSVDMTKLFEYISQDKTSDKEKGRIRRNLEFLRPTTVSRTSESSQLFQTLMDFPMPKPRTIEKPIKVFKWNSLVAGLNKVMEKYSWLELETETETETLTPCPPARPRSSMNKFHITLQRPESDGFTNLTSFDDAHAPDTLTQPEAVLATHVNPSWLHSQTLATPFVCGDMPPPSPRIHMTPDTEVSCNGQTLPHYEAFHHFGPLNLQLSIA